VLQRVDAAMAPELMKPGKGAEDTEVRRTKLSKAARDFEALFVYQLLKTMRASFVSTRENESGFGKDIFLSVADNALADRMSESNALGIGQLLLTSFEGRRGLCGKNVGSNGDDDDPFVSLDNGRSLSQKLRSPGFMRLDSGRAPRTVSGASAGNIDDLIGSLSRKYGLPTALVRAVIQVESAGDRYAVSARGAKGLMQLTDTTAAELGVTDAFDPAQNIDAGSRYLSGLLKRFSGDLKLALAAYNAGPGTVERHGGIPPYRETVRYVDKVMGLMQEDF